MLFTSFNNKLNELFNNTNIKIGQLCADKNDQNDKINNLINLIGNNQLIFKAVDLCYILHSNISDDIITNIIKGIPDHYKIDMCNFQNNISEKKINSNDNIYLTEAGMYYLIFNSKEQSAENFKLFICETVLPKIRRFDQDIIENKNV